jgi:hypothetical protein
METELWIDDEDLIVCDFPSMIYGIFISNDNTSQILEFWTNDDYNSPIILDCSFPYM